MGSDEKIFGIISDDIHNLPIGTRIGIEACDIKDNTGNHPMATVGLTSFNGVVLMLHFGSLSKRYHTVWGSAVLISPGIAFSATHVFENHIEKVMDGELGIMATGLTSEGMQIWRVTHIKFVTNTDIAILSLSYAAAIPSSKIFRTSKISTRVPRLGEMITICGFRASALDFEVTEKGFPTSIDAYVCNGKVIDYYPLSRDTTLCKGPTIGIDCPSPSGLSGGPAFDDKGLLIGILSTSFGEESPSAVSLIWPALAANFLGGWPGLSLPDKKNILTLPSGLCSIDKPEALTVQSDPTTGEYTVSYKEWN